MTGTDLEPTPTVYAIDRVKFVRDGDVRHVEVDGVRIGTLTRGWSRNGGEGWSSSPTGATHKTLHGAARPLIGWAVRSGRIVNVREASAPPGQVTLSREALVDLLVTAACIGRDLSGALTRGDVAAGLAPYGLAADDRRLDTYVLTARSNVEAAAAYRTAARTSGERPDVPGAGRVGHAARRVRHRPAAVRARLVVTCPVARPRDWRRRPS